VASYSLRIKRTAARDIEAIAAKADRQRIVRRISALADDPRPPGCEKLAGHEDRYRIRQGNYRILYTIEDAELLIWVVKVGHRRDVYR
jgi:mRNA interferase RelE/StbE